ncbi:MAG TPA: PUA domain-containing protein [archaeon]|nr:PUA domain-containing protein [archaeon]
MRRLKDREVKALLREFMRTYPNVELSESAKEFDEVAVGVDMVYFVDGVPLIVRTKFGLLPSLKFTHAINSLPRIIVDMGAVAHIANGADVMRPGIKDVRGDFGRGGLVVIADERFGKPIALGVAEVDSTEMRGVSKGKVIRSVHYVGDELWKNFGK